MIMSDTRRPNDFAKKENELNLKNKNKNKINSIYAINDDRYQIILRRLFARRSGDDNDNLWDIWKLFVRIS